jgi:hypothetical protein
MNSQFNKEELDLIKKILKIDLDAQSEGGYRNSDDFLDRLIRTKQILAKIDSIPISNISNNNEQFDNYKKASEQENTRLKTELDRLNNEFSDPDTNPFSQQKEANYNSQINIQTSSKEGYTMIEGKYQMKNETLDNMAISLAQCIKDAPRLYDFNLISRQMIGDLKKYYNTLLYPKALTIQDIQMIANLQTLYLKAVEQLKRMDLEDDMN